MSKDKNNKVDRVKEVNFDGAIVIDEQGSVITIEEEMIESAFGFIKDSILEKPI